MSKFLAILFALAAVLGSGWLHGMWSARWETSDDLEQAVALVPTVPTSVGDWTGTKEKVNPEAYAQTGARGYWMRRYKHKETGQQVTVILMCGQSGKMSVHTPNICYQGAGFLMQGDAMRFKPIADGTDEVWTADFYKENASGDQKLRIFWTWNADGGWQAPSNPRFDFRGQHALYKLYVVRDITYAPAAPETDPAVELMRLLLPQLRKTFFSRPAPKPQAILDRYEVSTSRSRSGWPQCAKIEQVDFPADWNPGALWSRKSPGY